MSDVITVQELEEKRERGEPVFLLDVREPHEHQICAIADSHLIPLRQLAENEAQLPKDLPIVVYCRSGHRSETAVQWLKARGFSEVKNLVGGILKYGEKVPLVRK